MNILAQLLGEQGKNVLASILGINQATQGMKDSTDLGDIFGGIQALGTVAGGIWGKGK